MKWKLLEPKVNDTRTYNKFAWFPTLVYKDNQTYRVWLEMYRVTEEYTITHVNSDGYYYRKAKWEVTKKEYFGVEE